MTLLLLLRLRAIRRQQLPLLLPSLLLRPRLNPLNLLNHHHRHLLPRLLLWRRRSHPCLELRERLYCCEGGRRTRDMGFTAMLC